MGLRQALKDLRGKFKSNYVPPDDNLESKKEWKERWRSINIIYFTMFLMSLGFSIIVTGVWPYLDKLDPLAGKEFMGYIVAANPLGQMVFSPIVGWWSNKLGSNRPLLILSLIIFMAANAMYSSIELLPSYRKYWMLLSRFLVGLSSANIAIMRSYIAAATRYSERTKAVSMISLAQVLGFILGPALQAAVVPLGEGFYLVNEKLKLDMYTACGWINVAVGFITIYFYTPYMFREHKIAGREAMFKQNTSNIKDTYKKPSYFATWTLIISFFILVFNFMLLETLMTPLTMDQFGWSKAESLKVTGILTSIGAVLSVATTLAIPYLGKRFSEVKIMVWGGFLFMALGRAIYIPFNNDPPLMYDSQLKTNLSLFCNSMDQDPNWIGLEKLTDFDMELPNYDESWTNLTEVVRNVTLNCGDDIVGCPSDQEWCKTIPALTVSNFVIGLLLTTFGYPLGVTLIQTLVTKHLGTRPQGLWMGILTGAGCLSRVMGPICVSYIYKNQGTILTFGITTAMMVATLIWLIYFEDEITPIEEKNEEMMGEELAEMGQNAENGPIDKTENAQQVA